MSRYLTPSKVCLLALIDVYLDGKIPKDAAVPFLSLILSNILPSKKSTQPSPLTLETFEQSLSSHQSSIPGRSLWDIFLAVVWRIDTADTLHTFFDEIERVIQRPKRPPAEDPEDEEEEPDREGIKLTRTSPLGTFVRRAHVEFTRLNFQDSIQLWKNFVAYREPSFHVWAKRAGSSAPRSFIDANLVDMADARVQDITYGDLLGPDAVDATYSTEDVERLLDYYVTDVSRTGNRLPEEVREKMADMSSGSITIPSASHYVKYLDAWKAGDYPAALDSLHRYFDYTIQTREKSHYQYALLNMALLHAHFGAYSEAISAMQETVATARENKDTACLNYSLSWLYHFGQAHPSETSEIQKSGVLGRGKEALAFLQSKARESGSWGLLSSSLVAEARLTLVHGDGLASAVENLVRASYLNLARRLPGSVGSVMAMESAMWKRLGVDALADVKDELFLECYATGGTDADAVHAICRRAATLSQRGRHGDALTLMNTGPNPNALRAQAVHVSWSACLGQLKMMHAIRRQDLAAAEQYLSQLLAMTGSDLTSSSSSASSVDPDMRFSVAHLHIRLLLAQGDLPGAMSLLEETSHAVDTVRADVYHRTRLMLTKVAIWARAGQAARGFSIVLRACSLASSARLLPLLWEGVTALGNILNVLGELDAAVELLVAALPQTLACRDCELAARAYTVLADSHVGLAGRAGKGVNSGSSRDSGFGVAGAGQKQAQRGQSQQHQQAQAQGRKRKEEIAKALEYLARAFDEWSAIKDVAGQSEALAKRAMLMQLSGDSQLANDCAAQYKAINDKAKEELKV